MTDTEIVDEILHKLKLANAGHFDRENMVDALDKVNFDLESVEDEGFDSEEVSRIKGIVERAISELEEAV